MPASTFIAACPRKGFAGLLNIILLLTMLAGASMVAAYNNNEAQAINVTQVQNIHLTGDSYPEALTVVNNNLFFIATDGIFGTELWKSDGTTAGTQMVKDIRPGTSSANILELTAVGNMLFFSANDGTNGQELWVSDGTPAGTVMVKDINPGSASSMDSSTNIGTMANVNGKLFFAANNGGNGEALWISDGTPAGTVMVKDINPSAGSAYIDDMTAMNGKLFFSAFDGQINELWKSDGTPGGTVMVKAIDPDWGSDPSNLTNVNGMLYFKADDPDAGTELFKSDGSAAGTVLVKDINPSGPAIPESLTNVNGTLFFTANDGVHGAELWKSNGTAAGTVMVKEIRSGSSGAFITTVADALYNANGTLFFLAFTDNAGEELWKSDGSEAGTVMVSDIFPGGKSSDIRFMTLFNGTLYFRANDGTNGHEVWQSNGTAAGTTLVVNLNPVGSADPFGLTVMNNAIFFSANDGSTGKELWKLTSDAPQPPPPDQKIYTYLPSIRR